MVQKLELRNDSLTALYRICFAFEDMDHANVDAAYFAGVVVQKRHSPLFVRGAEAQLLAAAEDSLEKNTAVMARHVRRIAQDLAGDVFATIPEMFIARIRKAADMFTRAGMDYTLLISSLDAQALTPALRDEEIFRAIRIVEDPDLPRGGFRLTSRDLEVEDVPELEGEPI